MTTPTKLIPAIQHPGETKSNDFRQRTAACEPAALRTFTPSLAVLARSEGAYHFTPEGRKLVDFSSGVLVANLGHNPKRWWQRVLDYMGLTGLPGDQFVPAVPLTSYNAISELEVQACERLLANMRRAPGGSRMEQVMWSASGSEAIQKSLWAATKRRPGQDMILATRKGFHGKKGLANAVTGSEADPDRDPRVRFLAFPIDECCNTARRREPLDLAPYQQELTRIWSELGSRICCLITEPYLGGGGSYHPQPEYLQLLQRFCREHDVLLIFDEIQACFGRTGPMYAFTHYGLEPDIVCLGKGLGNGIPVSAAVGRADVFASLKYGEASDTFSGNPLAAAAVLATLDEFESTDVLAQGQQLSSVLEAGLLRLQDTGLIAAVRGEGCVWGIECAAAGTLTAEQVATEIVRACYVGDAQGKAVHLLGALAGKVIRVSPPLVLSPTEAREYLEVMFTILDTLKRKLS